jgi:hypothetical protein
MITESSFQIDRGAFITMLWKKSASYISKLVLVFDLPFITGTPYENIYRT